jgi:hypothetical protein
VGLGGTAVGEDVSTAAIGAGRVSQPLISKSKQQIPKGQTRDSSFIFQKVTFLSCLLAVIK